jgi:mRNA interferase MazF
VVAFAADAVVLMPFPFSDLSQSKPRPALTLADAERGDWILCQITSNPYSDTRAVAINDDDFRDGSLHRPSFARPGKLFTASRDLIVAQVGALKEPNYRQIIEAVVKLLQTGLTP